MMYICVSNESNSVGWRTIQCYSSDFKNIEDYRNDKIDKIID